MVKRCNPKCMACTKAHNAINGRYCNYLRRYVEHDNQPACT